MLLREFARRAMDAHPDLVAAGGSCNAYAGLGDSYLPFVEILRLLTGDIESQRAVGALSREHAQRLREASPPALGALIRWGPALIDALLSRGALLERVRALPDGAQWEARVQQAIDNRPIVSSSLFLHDQVSQVLRAMAEDRPLLLILDDLQWADEASISLLFHLARKLAGARVLLLGAYRPEEVAQGRDGKPHPLQAVMHELQVLWEDSSLDLAQADGRALVEALVAHEPNRLGPGFRQALYRRTGGHALFTVELLRGLKDRGDLVRDAEGHWTEGAALDWERLPQRVEAVIAAHIARLPRDEQELLSVASIEGEEFHAEVVARVLRRDEQEVIASLSGTLSQERRLLRPESLRRLGEQQFTRYRFRHYLFQRYLYQRLDPLRRAHLHGEVAESLEALGAAARPTIDFRMIMADDRSDVLGGPEWVASEVTMAWHWEEAGLPEKAAAYHGWAGRRACYLTFDYQGIMACYTKVLGLLGTAPETPDRLRLEERSVYMVGWARGMSVSWLDPEVGRAWQRALDLAEKIGDPLLVADALTWMSRYHRQCGRLDTALALGERAVTMVEGGLPGWILWAHCHLALTLLYRGDLDRSARLLAPLVDSLLCTGSVQGPPWNLELLTYAPLALWCLGYPDQALQVGRAALAVTQRSRDRIQIGTESMVICNAILGPHQMRREVAGVEQGLEMLRPIVEERRCGHLRLPVVAMHEGWVHAQRGLLRQGAAEMRQALFARSRNDMLMRPYYKGLIAEALACSGRPQEGLVYLESALKQMARTNERWAEAELLRLKGELLLKMTGRRGEGEMGRHGEGEMGGKSASGTVARPTQRGQACCRAPSDAVARPTQRGQASCRAPSDEDAAECCFRQAIAVAQRQEAKSWELRAAISLARLLRDRGRPAEARDILAPIYAWFTEGFDTPDLQEARALLDP